jgi:hypothetical protein
MKPGEKIRIVKTDGANVLWDKVFVLQKQEQLPSAIFPPILDIRDISNQDRAINQ